MPQVTLVPHKHFGNGEDLGEAGGRSIFEEGQGPYTKLFLTLPQEKKFVNHP